MATLVISFPEQAGKGFDANHYHAVHAPLVEKHWGPHGFVDLELLLPMGPQPYRALVLLRFRDQAAIDAALASEGTGAIMADVARFTDIEPSLFRAAD